MTHIFINYKEAVIPDDLQFEIKMENPYFTGSSAHSLEIELPASPNTHIFGQIARLEAHKKECSYPAVLITNGYQLLTGTAIVTAVTDISIKIQLVSGNAELNFLCRDDIFLDEVEWENISLTGCAPEGYEYTHAFFEDEQVSNPILYNDGTALSNGFYPFIYLYHLLDVVFEYFGYQIGDSVIHEGWLKQILCVSAFKPSNAIISSDNVPDKWLIGDTWKGLPHWSVKEFIAKLEKFAGVIVVVDDKTRKVNIMPMNDFFGSSYSYITQVIDDYECSFQDEDKNNTTAGNLGYKLPSSSDNGFNRVKSEVYLACKKKSFASFDELKSAWNNADTDTRVSNMWQVSYHDYITKDNRLFEVNLMGDLIRDYADKNRNASLDIVPVSLRSRDTNVKEAGTGGDFAAVNLLVPQVYMVTKQAVTEVKSIQDAIEGKEEVVLSNDKDIMEVCLCQKYEMKFTKFSVTLPWTYIDSAQQGPSSTGEKAIGSLSLRSNNTDSMGYLQNCLTRISSSALFKIQFVMTGLPDIRSIFLIRNHRFVAKSIQMQVDSHGLDPVYEGEFFMVD